MLRKIFYLFLIFFIIPVYILAQEQVSIPAEARETIFYAISPFGSSVYQDFGPVEFRGRKMELVIFKTEAVGFKDTEKIYSDPETYLPLWIERDLSILFSKEFLTEEYNPKDNSLDISKFIDGKKTEEYKFKGKGPIHNAILLPFSLRKASSLKIGWTYDLRLPNEFKVKLERIEEVKVPAGKFKAYYFTSDPPAFQIWISADKLLLPVKIKGLSGFPYTLVMEKYQIRQ